MSGHSKWATIKRQKAVADAKRGTVYARMAREIIVAAKLGGGDTNANFKLRQAVERAKAEGVPNENINRAIEKGVGNSSGSSLEELIYEGYGPGGVAILVRCATDNRNRTAGDIRSIFSKHHGNLGETGCVNWIFKEQGQISLVRNDRTSEEDILTAALEAGAEDLDSSADHSFLITCLAGAVDVIQEAMARHGFEIISAEASLIPQSSVEVNDKETAKQLLKLIDALENQDDVQQVYANFEMDQAWIEGFQEFLG